MAGAAEIHTGPSPFHEGEQRIQEALGVREQMEPWARQVVRGHLPDEHAAFYTQLPFMVAAARDERGRPWATLLTGPPGFVQVPDAWTLAIGTSLGEGDALAGALEPGADLGLLGIELHSRRRNRVNGHVQRVNGGSIEVGVDQTFGNCPQYILARRLRPAPVGETPGEGTRSHELSVAQRRFIGRADTFFIASGHPGKDDLASHGMDASHRGGEPGFVHVEHDGSLVFPDYTGNNHFNTLGNLLLDPRAGLVFVDFEAGHLLQLTGHAEVDWAVPDTTRYPGARRLVRFAIDEVVEQRSVLPMRWESGASAMRSLQVVSKVRESDDVMSFVLEGKPGERFAPWRPGQHLPIEITGPDGATRIGRTYSLSSGPADGALRISVKRESMGRVSRFLHDEVEPGDMIRAGRPAGDFVLDIDATPHDRKIVLVAAGVGITPLASMLHSIAVLRPDHPVTVVHGIRDAAHHPLGGEIRSVIDALPNARLHVRSSRPGEGERPGFEHDDVGRVDAALLAELVDVENTDFYLCGPAAFMGDLQAGLEQLGVPAERVRFETF